MRGIGLAVCLVGLVGGCGGDEEPAAPAPAPAAPRTGKWFGFAVDGKTGERLSFFGAANTADDNDATDQIFVVADGEFRTARPCDRGEANDKNAITPAGCFVVDGLPLGVTIPVFVVRAGYHAFASTLFVDPVAKAPNAATGGFELESALFAEEPSLYANVRLFPIGADYDYTLTATINDQGAAGIQVRCVFDSAANAFDTVGGGDPSNYLPPSNDFNPILAAVTDAQGRVTFTGKELTKGATYQCFADGSDPVTGSPVANAGGISFTVGVSSPLVTAPLTAVTSELMAIWNDFGDETVPVGGLDGPMTVVLSRPVDLLTGSADCPNAYGLSVGLPSDAEIVTTLEADVDDDDAESVSVTLDAAGTTLTIAPKYDTRDEADRDVRVRVGGIFLVPRDAQGVVYGIGVGAEIGSTASFTLTDTATSCGAVAAKPLRDALTGKKLVNVATLAGP
jgi:hypothetical protein